MTNIAVIGSGISGLAAAWLLNQNHRVTLFEQEARPGGHTNTVTVDGVPVDTGFIVYNQANYPNLTALFDHLGVATQPSDMSFAASLAGGELEYSGTGLGGLFAQKRNLVRPRFWRMLKDVTRFYRQAPALLQSGDAGLSLGDWLAREGYSEPFVEDHLLPMAAAIWSCPTAAMRAHSAQAFVRFFHNHGLLRLRGRPQWRTVTGGARTYVGRLTEGLDLRLDAGVTAVRRSAHGVAVTTGDGQIHGFDQVVVATHADQALALLADPDIEERHMLGAFRYQDNEAVLHTDPALMPRHRGVWSSWNYIAGGHDALCVTYWMNRLQGLPVDRDLFVTLNPHVAPDPARVLRRFSYAHPVFDGEALAAQRRLWRIQGRRRTWFCGAYFGAGFHEDGLQAGLWVAERLGGVRRPWTVAEPDGRIHGGGTAGADLRAAA